MKRASIVVTLVLSIILALGPGYDAVGGPPTPPVEMVHAWLAQPVNLNPVVAREGLAYTFNMLIFDGLTELDENNVPRPSLAERWTISSDGLRYRFFLRKNVTWHDGRPFTANDVVFTVYSHLDPKVASNYRKNFDALVGYDQLTDEKNPVSPEKLAVKPVVALDRHTVEFRLRYPYAPFLTILQGYRGAIVPKHLLEGKDMNEADFNRRPVGTGRFRFVEWRPGERLVFAANGKYFRGRPNIDRLVIRIIPDQTVQVEELKKGTVHFVFLPPWELVDEMEKHPGIKVLLIDFPTFVGIMLNVRNELFRDRRVRQAMLHSIDRQALNKTVYRGRASTPTGPITRAHGSWAFDSTLQPFEFSPDKARAMLAEAGWRPGPDGVLQKDGRRFSFRLILEKRKEIEDVATFVQEQLRLVGIEVRLDISDRAAFTEKQIKGDYDAAYGHPSGWVDPDPETTNYFHSKGPNNSQGYANPRVDELLERGRRLVSTTERGPIYREVQKILHDDVPWLWLALPTIPEGWSTKFTGFSRGPTIPVGSYLSLHKVRPVK